jgi:Lamin Tail Domain/CHU_C Type IX secretion signal domain/Bacterial Ig-like domain
LGLVNMQTNLSVCMKNLLCIAFCLFALPVFCQFTDDFSDGNFTANPAWSGDAALFTVVSGQLRSNAGAVSASTDYYLSTPSTKATQAQWEFFVNLKFSPSGANFVDFYLISDNANLKAAGINGYFLRFGDTQKDISLWKITAGTTTKIIDGVDNVISSSTDNPFKIKVSRNAANVWSIDFDKGSTGTFTSGGSVTDAIFTTSSFFGIKIRQSTAASAANNHFFGNFAVGNIVLDLIPPTITSVIAASQNQLDVLFSESVEITSAQTAANYAVGNGLGNPASAVQDAGNPRLVKLTFAGNFTSGQANTLTVNGVKDLSGNAAAGATGSFTFLVITAAVARDVVINEIMADPDPVVGLPNSEYVEIFNRSNKNISLLGWVLEGAGTTPFGNVLIAPGEYVIVCPSGNTALFPTLKTTSWGTSNSALTNTGEPLRLKDNTGTVIDQVTYSDSWYQEVAKKDGGYSLERAAADDFCGEEANWRASVDNKGGTPGLKNSLPAPTPDKPDTLLLVFSEKLDTVMAKTIANYTLDKGITASAAKIGTDARQVIVALSPALTPNTIYSLTISNLKDCPGNVRTQNVVTSIAIPSPVSNAGDLVINELLSDETPQVGLPAAEFVEIYNRSGRVLDLKGITITDGSTKATLPAFTLNPDSYLILTGTSSAASFAPFGQALGVTGFPSLNNAGETLTLANAQGKVIDQVPYLLSWLKDAAKEEGGWSLERIDPNNLCGEIDNWSASLDPKGGTPGKINSVKKDNPDLVKPLLKDVQVENDKQLLVVFNEKMDSLSVSKIPAFQVDKGVILTSVSPLAATGFRQVRLVLSNALTPKTLYTLSVQNFADCAGNNRAEVQEFTFALPEKGDSGDVVINEVLFNPVVNGVDYVELYNRSDKYVNLNGWQLARIYNNLLADTLAITTQNQVILPKSYLAITSNIAITRSNYPRSADTSKAKDRNFLSMKTLPGYNDDAGTVILRNNTGKTFDRFDYTDKFHFRLLDDKEGVSLERISPDAFGNTPDNWHSAAGTEGYGTPGYRNSQFLQLSSGKLPFTISPTTFSPDEDGYLDITTFNYFFNNPGNIATIAIYDAYGRKVRQIAQNQSLAIEGFFQWDGTNDNGEKVRIGVYMVYVKLFDATGGEQTIRQPVVVASMNK